jgi:hypothetical protein
MLQLIGWILRDTLGILFACNAIYNGFNVYARREEHLEWSVDSDTDLADCSQVVAYVLLKIALTSEL